MTDAPQPRRPARAEVVGSLLRPPALIAAIEEFYEPGHNAKLEAERAKDDTHLHELEDAAIREAVRRQIAAGVDVITDGKFRRWRFANSFQDAVSGFGENPVPIKVYSDDGTVTERRVTCVVDRIRKIDSPAVREVEYLRSITDHPFKVTFPAPSFFRIPNMHFARGVSDRVYRDRDEFLEDVIAIERELVADAIAAGAGYIQFDYPVYPYLIDPKWVQMIKEMGDDPAAILEKALANDRDVLDGIPDDVTVAVHLCRGNVPPSRWFVEGSLEPVAERIFNDLPHEKFLVEWDDTARDGGYDPLRFVPKGKIVSVGLITTKRPQLEDEDAVLRRIDEVSRFLDIEQLAISTQCGFASGMAGNALDEDAQWRKLELVARIADRVWPRG